MLTMNLIRDKNSNPDKESYVINIQSEILNGHPGDAFNSNSTSENTVKSGLTDTGSTDILLIRHEFSGPRQHSISPWTMDQEF